MRIEAFSQSFVEATGIPHELKNCTVVIDALNFFYSMYEESNLQFKFGTECDNYAKYVKDKLSMFKQADITCYFLFKCGSKDIEQKIRNVTVDRVRNDFQRIHPILTSNIHVQVLQEMELNYMFTEYEAKSACIALAQRLSCPVISNDIEYTMRGVQYIPQKTLLFNNKNQSVYCKLISQADFIRNFKLDKDKLALFILLTDIYIFPKNTFQNFFQLRYIPIDPFPRNKVLIKELSKTSEEEILRDILDNVQLGEERILEELSKVKTLVRGGCTNAMAINYFFNGQEHELSGWFLNGIAANYITNEYIHLYRANLLFEQANESNDYLKSSIHIIKYAYDLLTNFSNNGCKYVYFYRDSLATQTVEVMESIKKPTVQGIQSFFQNGWNEVRSLGLFEHYFREKINFDCNNAALDNLNDDCKLLMITLVYISHNSNISTFTSEMAYGVLLSYVMLGIVNERVGTVDDVHGDDPVNTSDCKSASDLLNNYLSEVKLGVTMNNTLVTSLWEFEYCLLQINNLNKLCGSKFKPTVYRKTYNGTLVYRVIHTMRDEGIILSVKNILNPDSTVLKLYNDIVEIYNTLVSVTSISHW